MYRPRGFIVQLPVLTPNVSRMSSSINHSQAFVCWATRGALQLGGMHASGLMLKLLSASLGNA
jgi:hypothetical protein